MVGGTGGGVKVEGGRRFRPKSARSERGRLVSVDCPTSRRDLPPKGHSRTGSGGGACDAGLGMRSLTVHPGAEVAWPRTRVGWRGRYDEGAAEVGLAPRSRRAGRHAGPVEAALVGSAVLEQLAHVIDDRVQIGAAQLHHRRGIPGGAGRGVGHGPGGDVDGEHAGEELGPPEASRLRRGLWSVVLVVGGVCEAERELLPGGRERRRGNDARAKMMAICEHTEVSGHVKARRRA